jgi:hypothetical protein
MRGQRALRPNNTANGRQNPLRVDILAGPSRYVPGGEMTDLAKPTKKKTLYSWFLWWIIDPAELEKQITNYDKLKIYQSARGISLLLFVGTAIFTSLMTEFVTHNRLDYIDSGVFLILGVFIYFHHRWAMILGMVFWTLDKLMQLVAMVQQGHATNPIQIVLFWSIFMHAMFLAYRVEQERGKWPAAVADAFD